MTDMTWHYQALKEGDEIGIYEVFLREDGSYYARTEEPVTIWGYKTAENLQLQLRRVARDIDRFGILSLEEFDKKVVQNTEVGDQLDALTQEAQELGLYDNDSE